MIPQTTLKRIIKAEEATVLVSKPAIVEYQLAVEAYAMTLAEAVCKLARHAGRKTIKAEDIRLAIE